MAAVAAFPSSHNVFVPSHEASGKMIVDFSRNPKDFALPNYVQYTPIKVPDAYYLEMTLEEAARIINTDGADFDWPDEAPRPSLVSDEGKESFQFKAIRSKRYEKGVPLGDRTIESASWDIVAQYSAIKGQQMMTWRTQKAITTFTTSGNYAASHTSAVASISGNTGTWSASTTARQDIKRSLNYAASVIGKDTFSVIKPSELVLVMSPDCARAISETQEIADYLKGSPEAWAYVKGDLANQNKNVGYGLPPTLYGYEVVIENAVKVTSRKGATKASSYVLADTTPFMCARKGGLEGLYGGPSFTSVTMFFKEEMTVETLADVNNRRTAISVVDDFACVFTAPVSAFLFTSAV